MYNYVIDRLKEVAEGVEHAKAITEAIRSGRAYVKEYHPEIQDDLHDLVDELQKNVRLIKRASEVLTDFRFAIVADSKGEELRSFNDYYIKSKKDAEYLTEHINNLRTHCGRIRTHAGRIAGVQNVDSDSYHFVPTEAFMRFFGFVGVRSPEKEAELGEKLQALAEDDFAVANTAEIMLECLTRALEDVQNALSDGGAMYPQNVPAAAALLADYSTHFQKMEDRAAEAERGIREFLWENA